MRSPKPHKPTPIHPNRKGDVTQCKNNTPNTVKIPSSCDNTSGHRYGTSAGEGAVPIWLWTLSCISICVLWTSGQLGCTHQSDSTCHQETGFSGSVLFTGVATITGSLITQKNKQKNQLKISPVVPCGVQGRAYTFVVSYSGWLHLWLAWR